MAANTTTQPTKTPPPPPPPQPPPPPSPPPTLLLGKYEQGKLLGHGTFAKVYLAKNLKTNELVAIKVLNKEKIIKGGFTTNIKREISILRRVRHPNIVKLLEVMATKTKIYFVMEFVNGGQLFNKVSKGRLKEDLARKYFQQLISAVRFCHDRGVYHRDLKPENLLLDENGDLKVSDFGLSTVSDRIQNDGLFYTLCGTPAYVAPEVLAGKGYDGSKFDLWSCGVILFVLMAGYLPFHDSNVMMMYRKIRKGEFKCPRWFSPDLVRLLRRLLDTNPDTRITISQVMENKWFKKGFERVRYYIEDNRMCIFKEEGKSTIQYDPTDVKFEKNNGFLEDKDVDPKRRDQTITTTDMRSEEGSVYTKLPVSSNNKETKTEFVDDFESESEFVERRSGEPGLPRPASLNAFDIISFSRGFDLSGLFDEEGSDSRFVSGAPVSTIISKLEEIAKVVRFTIRVKDCKVSLEGSKESAKGKLALQAEVFELTPSLSMVEIKKQGGDKGEYEEFYHTELLPSFENISITKSHSCSSMEFANSLNLPSDTE